MLPHRKRWGGSYLHHKRQIKTLCAWVKQPCGISNAPGTRLTTYSYVLSFSIILIRGLLFSANCCRETSVSGQVKRKPMSAGISSFIFLISDKCTVSCHPPCDPCSRTSAQIPAARSQIAPATSSARVNQ